MTSMIRWRSSCTARVRRAYALIGVGLWMAATGAQAQSPACSPPPSDPPRLHALPSGIHTVQGTLVSFDPCHRSVALRTPFFSDKPPLMIVVHGGAGLDSATANAADAFRSKGMTGGRA